MPAANGGSVPALPDFSPVSRPDPTRWNDLRKRVVSAAVLAPAALLCIWYGGTPYKIMLIGGAVGLAWEWAAMCGASALRPPGVFGAAAVVLGTLLAALDHVGIALAVFGCGAALTAMLASGFAHWRALVFGVPYAGIGTIAMLWLRADPVAGLANLLFALLLVWASDIGAYAAGRLLAGPKLAPRISPGKTWTGALGGLAAAMGAGLLVAFVSQGALQPWRVAAIAAALGIVAQAGDLLESLIKRHFGVKDSGHLIPGHGGLLDRVDALLTAAPVAALLALSAGRGVVLWQ
jgi:phosphatidate cytidylyltransferase